MQMAKLCRLVMGIEEKKKKKKKKMKKGGGQDRIEPASKTLHPSRE
jgi:hypothetical protein